jgi:hypothetical protein
MNIKTGDLRQNQAAVEVGPNGALAPIVYVTNFADFPGGGGSSGGLTDVQLRAAPVPVSGPLTDTQLRAAAVPVSHGGLTDTQLRASALPVSVGALPLPAGAGTAAKQDTIIGYIDGIETLLAGTLNVVGNFYPVTQPVSGTVGISGTVPVSGTFWQATQPISGAVSITGSVAVTGTFWQATQPVSLAALPALVAGAAVIGKVGFDLTTPGTTNGVSLSHVGATAVATGNGVVGAGVQRVAIASDNSPVPVTATPATPSAFNLNSLATTNLGTIKNAAATLFGLVVSNNGAAAAFVKIYDKASNPTLASDKAVLVVPVPASGSISPNLGALGLRFATGLAIAITNLVGDTDATAVAANQVKVAMSYV